MNDGQLVKQVKEANDIVSVVGSYLHLTQSGSKYKGLCPFHDDSRPSLFVDAKWQNFKCWVCHKSGDVFTFIQEYEKISFPEALELLARRAGININNKSRSDDSGKLRLIDAMRWAAELYQHALLEDPGAEAARHYLGERKLLGETVRKFGLGFAPNDGDWLARQASKAPVPVEDLQEAGLLAPSNYGTGYYDRFRDRVMFPIRDLKGQIVGFGGRILPDSHLAERGPKYYNTSENAVFKKGELVYGLDAARIAAQAAGYLAVVEGYTDVLMAHQYGVTNVVATLGTALTADHIRQLRRFVKKVVLVYDADAGGNTGVDRALELFVREDMDLAIAALPQGMDPCDFLVRDGSAPFKSCLEASVNVLDFKLEQLVRQNADGGIEANNRSVEAVLAVLALAPVAASSATDIRRDLMLSRIAQRFGLRQESLRTRLDEQRRRQPRELNDRPAVRTDEVAAAHQIGTNKADPLERQLVQVLLAEPVLTAKVKAEITLEEINHPDVRRVLIEMFELLDNGVIPELDAIRPRLFDMPKVDGLLLLREVGLHTPDRIAWLDNIVKEFRQRRTAKTASELKGQLKSVDNHDAAMELLRKLQQSSSVVHSH